MNVFDSFCTSIAAVSTGGFSNNANSIGGYDSIAIEVITIVLMCLGSTNFLIHLYLVKRQFKKIWNHSEVRFSVVASIAIIPVMIGICMVESKMSFAESLRVSAFQFYSSLSTTGFQNVASMKSLPSSFRGIMIVLMLIGGSVGSTAGGIKQSRVVGTIKGAFENIRNRDENYRVIKHEYIHQNGEEIIFTKDSFMSSASFTIAYLLIFFAGSFVFSLFGYSLGDSMFEFASSIGTVGLSVGITGFNAHPLILLTSICGMILGRLEIVVVFNAFGKLLRPFRKG
jgi:trk system potassium uptake protein TrkH